MIYFPELTLGTYRYTDLLIEINNKLKSSQQSSGYFTIRQL